MSYQPIRQGQTLSAGNTQAVTILEAQPGTPWVGAWEQTRDDGIVRMLTVLAATNPAISGVFTFEFSEDGVTPTISEARQIQDFDTVRDFDLINAGAFYRVQFEPDATLGIDTVFVTTTYRPFWDGQFVRLGNQEIEEQNAAFGAQWAYIKAFQRNGKSIGITANSAGGLLTADDAIEIARGNFEGTTGVRVVGRNPSIVTSSTPEDIWLAGDVYTGHHDQGPALLSIVSNDASDTAAGTGAQTVRVWGLEDVTSTAYKFEDIAMAGVAPVVSLGNFYRATRIEVLTAGSQGTNDGTITVTRAGTGEVYLQIPAEEGASSAAVFTVPAQTTLFIQNLAIALSRTSGSAGSGHVALQRRVNGNGAWVPIANHEVTQASPVNLALKVPIVVEATSDLRFRCFDVSDNTTQIAAEFDGVLVDDIA